LDDTDTEDDDPDSRPTRELHRIAGGRCQDCATAFSAKEAVWSIALGFKNAPRCLACLCLRLGREEQEFRISLIEYVHRRQCYLRAWWEAKRMDANQPPANPDRQVGGCEPPAVGTRDPGGSGSPELYWDAGDLGCGDLVMQLRMRLKNMPAGSVIRVTATDPAAPEDIPAWCRLTGHTLLSAEPPTYTIRRKED
jgi:tRNA 2-thiouridine synthesizing protein A